MHVYHSTQRSLSKLTLHLPGKTSRPYAPDLRRKMSWPWQSSKPGWSGFMQCIQIGNYRGQSCFTFLLVINVDPRYMSCISSTLHFMSTLALRYNKSPVLTCDQPLWWKATRIVDSELQDSVLKSTVLRLGGFRTEMSFLGSIRTLRARSGLLLRAYRVCFSSN